MVGFLGQYADCWSEIRSRMLTCLSVWAVFFGLCFYFRYDFLDACRYLTSVHTHAAPPIVALSVLDAFYVTFELAFYVSLLLSVPVVVYQCWRFLSPALFLQERRLFRYVLCLSMVLFFLGVLLGWCVLLPMLLRYAHWFLPKNVLWLLGLRQYVSIFWYVGLYVGLFMQLPLVVFLTVYSGYVGLMHLARMRPYVLLGCFIVGMLVTPPDMFAQIMFAVPCYALFELGYLACLCVDKLYPSRRELIVASDLASSG